MTVPAGPACSTRLANNSSFTKSILSSGWKQILVNNAALKSGAVFWVYCETNLSKFYSCKALLLIHTMLKSIGSSLTSLETLKWSKYNLIIIIIIIIITLALVYIMPGAGRKIHMQSFWYGYNQCHSVHNE